MNFKVLLQGSSKNLNWCFKTLSTGGSKRYQQRSFRTNLYKGTLTVGISAVIFIPLYLRKKACRFNEVCCDAAETIDSEESKCDDEKFQDGGQFVNAINRSRDVIRRIKDEVGAPGIVVGVSIDGRNIWEEGFGFADIENRVPCSSDTVMRIASVSKSITMAALAKLWEEGKVDLDKPVHEYVPNFPEKIVQGEKVQITCRHLVSHLSGIRHYDRKEDEKSNEKKEDEFESKEYLLKNNFATTSAALDLFKDDELFHKPGTKYMYTTHGWTLVSAVIEGVTKEPFTKYIAKMFNDLGLEHTYLDVNDQIIYHRSKYYSKNKKGCLINSPYVDNSYKWAGGGFLSTVGDILKFGNIMLYSSQTQQSHGEGCGPGKKGFLKPETMRMIWRPVPKTENKNKAYGMGWVVAPGKTTCGFCQVQEHYLYHTGGAIGASSVLLIFPRKCGKEDSLTCHWTKPPKGIVVAIVTNMQSVNLSKSAFEIARFFETLELP